MTLKNFIKRTGCILFVLSFLLLFAAPGRGWCMTTTGTIQYIKIPITEWNDWKNDWTILDQELIACKNELSKIKKPSSELVIQLTQAEKMLSQLKMDLEKQNADLITLSKQVDESKIELQTLKEKINKERKVHKRQIWQNRIWVFIGGVVVGYLIK